MTRPPKLRQARRATILTLEPRPKPRLAAPQARPRGKAGARVPPGAWSGLRPAKPPRREPRQGIGPLDAPKPRPSTTRDPRGHLRFMAHEIEGALGEEEIGVVFERIRAFYAAARGGDEGALLGEALWRAAWLHLQLDAPEEAMRLIHEAISLAEARRQPVLLARSWTVLALESQRRGQHAQALGLLERAQASLGEGYAPGLSASIYQRQSISERHLGRLDEAAARLHAAEALTTSPEPRFLLAEVAQARGDAEGLERFCREGIMREQAEVPFDVTSPGLLLLSERLIDLGALGRARVCLDEVEARTRAWGDEGDLAEVEARRARCARRAGDVEEARRRFEVALAFGGWRPQAHAALLLDAASVLPHAGLVDRLEAVEPTLRGLEGAAELRFYLALEALSRLEDEAAWRRWRARGVEALRALEEAPPTITQPRARLIEAHRLGAMRDMARGDLDLAKRRLACAEALVEPETPLLEIARLRHAAARVALERDEVGVAKGHLLRAARPLARIRSREARALRALVDAALAELQGVEAEGAEDEGPSKPLERADVKLAPRAAASKEVGARAEAPGWLPGCVLAGAALAFFSTLAWVLSGV